MAGGLSTTERPRLAVIVMSHGDRPQIAEALDSLRSQEIPLEIVVSHSGGRPPGLPDGVALTHRDALRMPGAARNAGVAATAAPFVAFLAGDCTAQPGWAAARLARHEAGAAAVASAMSPPAAPAPALASHLLQHWSRMPHRQPRPPERFGVSYARGLLDAFGGFREDVAFAEDAELNARILGAGVEIEWAPEVLLEHRYPRTPRALVTDAFARSRRRAAVGGRATRRLALAARALAATAAAVVMVLAPGSPVARRRLWTALPLLMLGALAGCAGALIGAPPEPGALAELHFHRFARGRR